MNLDELIDICTIRKCLCGFYHASIRPHPATHRDDAMNSRCNICENIVRYCLCEWGELANKEGVGKN